MSKINLFDLFISLIIVIAIFLFIVAIALTINDYMIRSYEYETIDGEKGTAMYCIDPYREIPYCILNDGTKLYGIKQYKKVQKRQRMSWTEVKAKQAENIAKLYEKNPDDWFYKSQMEKPVKLRTGFAPYDGTCWNCHRDICEGDKAITVESLGDYIIIGCPYCHKSYCD